MAVSTPPAAARTAPVTVIEPSRASRSLVREVGEYAELLYFFAWRDVKIRYKQAVIGFAWAVMQPVVMMAIFTVVFGRLAEIPSDGLPYALFAFAGLLPWTYFANAVTSASESLVQNANLVSKVYFPRLSLPLAAVLGYLPDLGIASLVLVVLMAFYGMAPAWTALALPLFVVFAVLAALSVSIWLAALNVAYRDVKHVVPFLVQVWLFATPVVYPASLVPPAVRPLYGLNPMAGVVEGFRWALLNAGDAPWTLIATSAAVVVVGLVSGLWYFKRVEGLFADLI